ncbi:MAG: hypothetical protein D6772_05605 [Bacteroidetes bacterium]|nr:MAG: hypothetical protein D6772_05605 [Bacteroidota bacterium]
MNSAISNSIVRWIVFWLLQVFLFKYVVWGWGGKVYLQVHFYPLFIYLLPFATPRILTIVLAFTLGLAVDWLYETPGMHAGALVFTAYLRRPVLNILAPREGYNPKDSPTKASLGDAWFLRYISLLTFLHLAFYYLLESFTILYWNTILIQAVVSLVGSLFFMLLYVYIINPKV